MKSKGFTLIELLVVIAIIGILSSVVLASLNTARNKGADAALKANLTNIRAQAELVYDDASPNSYDGVCANTQVATAILASENTAGGAALAECFDDTDAWGAAAKLKGVTDTWFCVDNTGKATTVSGDASTPPVGAADFAC
jgi:prepilin-type N-terminal cleavage/methylation domain-containing protein